MQQSVKIGVGENEHTNRRRACECTREHVVHVLENRKTMASSLSIRTFVRMFIGDGHSKRSPVVVRTVVGTIATERNGEIPR